jgi:hypothetical protein
MIIPKRLRNYLDVIIELGCEVDDVCYTGSSHYKIQVTSSGNKRFFIVPFSASDHRALKNFNSDIKRWLRSTTDSGEHNENFRADCRQSL